MPTLLSIVELGGYPDFTSIYKQAGYDVIQVASVRKAQSTMKKNPPDVVVAEFNFQSDFRDRTSNLESLMATLQGKYPDCKVIVMYEQEFEQPFRRLNDQYPVDVALCFPVQKEDMKICLESL
jgi:hypothetical protein